MSFEGGGLRVEEVEEEEECEEIVDTEDKDEDDGGTNTSNVLVVDGSTRQQERSCSVSSGNVFPFVEVEGGRGGTFVDGMTGRIRANTWIAGKFVAIDYYCTQTRSITTVFVLLIIISKKNGGYRQ